MVVLLGGGAWARNRNPTTSPMVKTQLDLVLVSAEEI
jgi:hypothetical protein